MGREKGKDEEIVGATRNTLRETTGALRGRVRGIQLSRTFTTTTQLSSDRQQHRAREHPAGNRRQALCGECERLNNAGGPVGGLTGL